jgi:hypothetical protein
MTASPLVDSSWSEPAASGRDSARAATEAEEQAAQRLSAVRAIAGRARDADDARRLLDILGLGADEIRAAAKGHSTAA